MLEQYIIRPNSKEIVCFARLLVNEKGIEYSSVIYLRVAVNLIYSVRFISIVAIINFQLTTRNILKVNNYVINFLRNN